jgi:hypothetical protein
MEMAMTQSLERGERLLLLLSPEELAAVEDFRRRHQLSSRSEAVHAILRKSLGVPERAAAPARPVAKPAAAAMPMTKPMTKPWHRAKRRSLSDI